MESMPPGSTSRGHLFLFSDDKYYEMKENKLKLNLVRSSSILYDFKINSKRINAALSLEGSGMLFKDVWFYVIPETHNKIMCLNYPNLTRSTCNKWFKCLLP